MTALIIIAVGAMIEFACTLVALSGWKRALARNASYSEKLDEAYGWVEDLLARQPSRDSLGRFVRGKGK